MYRKLVFATLGLIVVVAATGWYVRVQGAGLACPDVPLCYGRLWLPENLPPEGVKAYPGFLYDRVQAWIQMGHRLAALALGGLLILLAGLAWWQPQRRIAVRGSFGLLALYGLQVGLGSGIVMSRLWPVLVAAHLLIAVGMAALALRFWLKLKPRLEVRLTGLCRLAGLAGGITLLEIFLGGWVSANFAGLACLDFPTCQGSWWPALDWRAFAFWEQWEEGNWALLEAQARITLHWLHRLGAALAFAVLFSLGISISSNPKVPHVSKLGVLINCLLFAEIALGIGILKYHALPALVVAHGLGGMALFLAVSAVGFHLRYAPAIAQIPVPATEAQPSVLPPTAKPEAVFERLKAQLEKTRRMMGFLSLPFAGKDLDEELAEEIETHLLMADVGVNATCDILGRLRAKLSSSNAAEVKRALRETLLEILEPCSLPLRIDPTAQPFVILVVGVNGVGKTTTIGKLAQHFKRQGYSVMLAAGDTFRAAAVEQLKTWGERLQVPVVAQHSGADSASVIYDALQSAKARKVEVLIADTAGRLHTKSNLMEELAKIKRILAKLDPSAPHEVLLVLDATTGQNAIAQAEQFHQAIGVSGLVLTKLDGTAKGGVIFALAEKFKLPIRFIGIGEGVDDLQDFDARAFVEALFAETKSPVVLH
jgi:fused signal recognition particle receptor